MWLPRIRATDYRTAATISTASSGMGVKTVPQAVKAMIVYIRLTDVFFFVAKKLADQVLAVVGNE